ncbi:DEAD/DEAH box helicase [bacterium]|nr:DEAD/DEAH box helicase [bacterium]
MSLKTPTRKFHSPKPRRPDSPSDRGRVRDLPSRAPRIDPEALRAANPQFAELGVRPECLGLLKNQSITEPTPIQTSAIPPALAGRDVVAIAQTGTGKTLAFGLPLLARLAETGSARATALILTPTRELAQQIYDVLQPLARLLGVRATCVYGGVSMDRQVRDLRAGGGVIIATPGRLLDHVARGNTAFDRLSTLVLDEADRMLDMGFLPDIRRIMNELPAQRQTLMFSATFPSEIARLTEDMLNDPLRLEAARSATPSDTVRQCVYTVDHESKQDLLTKLLDGDAVRSAIIFVRTKRRADRVAKALERGGYLADAIHGDRSQSQRRRAIDSFARGKFKYLVATDVAARGIDVSGISHVINYDIPACSDDYVHRIGRTARAHADGDAITFVSQPDAVVLRDIEKALGMPLEQIEWEGAVALSASHSDRTGIVARTTRPGWSNQPFGKPSGNNRRTWKPRGNRRRVDAS